MSTAELRKRTKKTIDGLSGVKLQFAADFLSYVDERESEEATRELLNIPGFQKSYEKGLREINSGRTVDWRNVRRYVYE